MLALQGISKRYGATHALEDVSLSLSGGEICGLVGHNGAGKSTLIKIVAGAVGADAGALAVDGRPARFAAPHDAYAAGIRVIHQDAPLVPDFDTVENCFLGRPYPRRLGLIDRAAMRKAIAAVARTLAPEHPLEVPIAFLSPAEKQFVRLLRAIADEGRLLVLDEPTAALPAEDAERFFAILSRMRAHGTAIMLVSHRLDEIVDICDRAVVLQDGRRVEELAGASLTVERLITAMGAGGQGVAGQPSPVADAPVTLELEDVAAGEMRQPVSLRLRASRVVALYGLAGSGRSSLLHAIWGAERATGRMTLAGGRFRPRSPRDAVRAGISCVPADRHRTGLFPALDLVANKTLPLLSSYRRHPRLPIPSRRAERAAFLVAAERVSMAFGTPGQLAATLSGGNQQKLLFSRWATRHSRVMLLDEPTEGVDVASKGTIRQIIRDIAADGNAVLVSTSDREEALELGDEIAVFRDGALSRIFTRAEATAEALSNAAQGRQDQPA